MRVEASFTDSVAVDIASETLLLHLPSFPHTCAKLSHLFRRTPTFWIEKNLSIAAKQLIEMIVCFCFVVVKTEEEIHVNRETIGTQLTRYKHDAFSQIK